MKTQKEFAVRSNTKSWHLYNAFAEELKIMGFEVATHFNDFHPATLKTRDCIYVTDKWNGRQYPPSFTFSCTTGEVIVLETNWEEAIQAAKDFMGICKEKRIFKLTNDYNAEIDYGTKMIKVGCQNIPFYKVVGLYNLITNQKNK